MNNNFITDLRNTSPLYLEDHLKMVQDKSISEVLEIAQASLQTNFFTMESINYKHKSSRLAKVANINPKTKLFFYVYALQYQEVFKTANRLLCNMLFAVDVHKLDIYKELILAHGDKFKNKFYRLYDNKESVSFLQEPNMRLNFIRYSEDIEYFDVHIATDDRNITGYVGFWLNGAKFITEGLSPNFIHVRYYFDLLNMLKQYLREQSLEDIKDITRKFKFL